MGTGYEICHTEGRKIMGGILGEALGREGYMENLGCQTTYIRMKMSKGEYCQTFIN
jgi:hypothetical protein